MAATTVDPDRSGTRALRRVLRHYVRRSRDCLATEAPSDEAVHEARKGIKKSRAALRLLRPALGSARYRRSNRTLRDAAHALNALRDALVLIQTLVSLRRDRPTLRRNRAAALLAARLRQELSRARHELTAHADTLRAACSKLQRMERRARRWRVERHGWSTLGPALCRIYRQGRRVLPTASDHPADAALHEWRKQVKYLRYALKMLSPVQPGPLGALEKQAGAIAEQLGHAHDLALLHSRAQLLGAEAASHLRPLLQGIESARVQRAFAALVAGERLFQSRPRDLKRALGRAWRSWRRRQR